MFICYIYLLFLIIVSFRYFSSADNIKHAKDALTVEMEKIEKSLKMTTTAVAETIAENPKKTARLEVQVGSSSSESSLKGLFEEILQEHDEEHAAGTTSTCSTSDICDGANYLTLRQPIPVLGSQPSSVSHSGCHCCKVSLCPWYQRGQRETVQHSI